MGEQTSDNKPEQSADHKIAFQGMPGAFSHLACQTYHPTFEPVSVRSFEGAFREVREGRAKLAMIPVENSLVGRVSDIYQLLPEGGLSIVAEHYLPVHHNLLVLPGTKKSEVKIAHSHPMALSQVRHRLLDLGILPVNDLDTAGAAHRVSQQRDNSIAAIASTLAGEIYGLEVLMANIEDAAHNTTRFLTLAREPQIPNIDAGKVVTSFVFKVRNVPSALYKSLGGFATNGVNLTKLESYMLAGSFSATQFYVDVEAHPEDLSMVHAMEELEFFSDYVIPLGTYLADKSRDV